MNELSQKILGSVQQELFSEDSFPFLTQWGVKDEDVLIHSLGVSFWTVLGYQLGFTSICECPVPPSTANLGIRSDAVWFSKQEKTPLVFVEFERYQGSCSDKVKLEKKL